MLWYLYEHKQERDKERKKNYFEAIHVATKHRKKKNNERIQVFSFRAEFMS